MKVAVVMPVYNSGKYLSESIESILAQTYRDFVLIAVDDGSTDDSLQILRGMRDLDKRIVIIEKTNGGAAAARNAALDYIERTCGFDLLSFLDSDDVVEPDFLETFVCAAEEYEADYVVSGFLRWFRNSGLDSSKWKNEQEYLLDKTEVLLHFAGDPFFKKKAPEATSNLLAHRCFSLPIVRGMRFREDLRVCEDQEFIVRALLKVKRGVVSRKITYLYRQRRGALTRDVKDVDSEIRFIFWLFSVYEERRDNLRRALLLYITRFWWATTKKVYEKGLSEKYKRDLCKILGKLRGCKEVYGLPKRYIKRVLFCWIGGCFLPFYFRWGLSKKYRKNTELFE